ncbi:MAG: short-chain dehydrogenase [Candidatus Rokuibacteriota bacterium]|nr:MAG: short-chain dehydrogenase [Candidatus Rokubacteria bacterium]
MGNFSGQAVLITGASSGIGEALAREFARRGGALVLAARRTDRLDRLVAELTAGGARAIAVRCDVTIDGDPERAAAAARQSFGRLDVVVANAGFGVVGPFALLTLDDYRRQFETNVFGVLRTLKATLADVRRARGRVAIIGSVSGHLATPGSSPYAMSKFAVRALAEALGHELASSGVSVTLASPGFVASEIRRVDNEGILRDQTPEPIPGFLIMSTARAARQIVRAIARRRREVVVTGHGKAVVFLHRHAPWLTSAVIRKFGVRSRRDPGGT